MSEHRNSPWKRVPQVLGSELTLQQQQLSLFQDIDQSEFGAGADCGSLEALFTAACHRFSAIHSLESPVDCYVCIGLDMLLLEDPPRTSPPARPITISPSLEERLLSTTDRNPSQVTVLSSEEAAVSGLPPEAKTILLCPMLSESKRLLCVFLILDTEPKGSSLLDSAFLSTSVIAFVRQLAIAYSHHEHRLEQAKLAGLWETLSKSRLSPTRCFAEAAKLIPEFLPRFGPLGYHEQPPEVQILMVVGDSASGAPELVIRGTTGEDPVGTRVAIDRSISGMLLQTDPAETPYFCDNPAKQEYADFSRWLHGQHVHTELAVRLMLHERPVGVLILDSERNDAFNGHHIDALLRLSESIVPILTVFEMLHQMNSTMQMSITSSTSRYLDAMVSVYQHAMSSPLAALRMSQDMISLRLTRAVSNVERALEMIPGEGSGLPAVLQQAAEDLRLAARPLDRLSAAGRQIAAFQADFAKDVIRFSETGPMDLRATIDAAAQLVRSALLPRLALPIEFRFVADETLPETRVCCSSLLKQHLYNIFHNSILAIEERLAEGLDEGVISIAITRDLPSSRAEFRLNAWAVTIRDNGKGVTPEQLLALRLLEHGTRFRSDSGTGWGLAAAQRFMASIGGRLEVSSVYGEGFEVVLHINEDGSAVRDATAP